MKYENYIPKYRFAKPVTLEYWKDSVKKKQYASQNQTVNRLEPCFMNEMAFKPNKNAENGVDSAHDFVICPRKEWVLG